MNPSLKISVVILLVGVALAQGAAKPAAADSKAPAAAAKPANATAAAKPADPAAAKAGQAASGAAPAAGAAGAAAAAPAAKTDEGASFECRREILVSYGLTPMSFSKQVKIEMCKFVTHSCCEPTDQVAIYKAFREGGEAERLKSRLDSHIQIYTGFMATAEQINNFATKVITKLASKKLSNCKIMARRIVSFSVKDVANRLKENLRTMYDFIQDSYKGFYCALCDAKSHQFMDPGRSLYFYSTGFCKDILSKSLSTLLYFHVHFIKYANISARFLQSCNFEGTFTPAAPDSQIIMPINNELKNTLESCRDVKDDPRWVDICRPICQRFDIASYNGFFSPHVSKYQAFTLKIRQMLDVKAEEEKRANEAPAAGASKPPKSQAGAATGQEGAAAAGQAAAPAAPKRRRKLQTTQRQLSNSHKKHKKLDKKHSKKENHHKENYKKNSKKEKKHRSLSKAHKKNHKLSKTHKNHHKLSKKDKKLHKKKGHEKTEKKEGHKKKDHQKEEKKEEHKKKHKKHKKDRELQKTEDPGRVLYRDLRTDDNDPTVFNAGLNAPVDLRNFRARVDFDGIELYAHGKQSFIDDANYKSALALSRVTKPTPAVEIAKQAEQAKAISANATASTGPNGYNTTNGTKKALSAGRYCVGIGLLILGSLFL